MNESPNHPHDDDRPIWSLPMAPEAREIRADRKPPKASGSTGDDESETASMEGAGKREPEKPASGWTGEFSVDPFSETTFEPATELAPDFSFETPVNSETSSAPEGGPHKDPTRSTTPGPGEVSHQAPDLTPQSEPTVGSGMASSGRPDSEPVTDWSGAAVPASNSSTPAASEPSADPVAQHVAESASNEFDPSKRRPSEDLFDEWGTKPVESELSRPEPRELEIPGLNAPLPESQPVEEPSAEAAPSETGQQEDRSALGEEAFEILSEAEQQAEQLREDIEAADDTCEALESREDCTNQMAWKLAQSEELLGRAQDEIQKRDEVIERLAAHVRSLNDQMEAMESSRDFSKTQSVAFRRNRRRRWVQIRQGIQARIRRIKKAEAQIYDQVARLKMLRMQQKEVESTQAKLIKMEKVLIRRWARAGAGVRLCYAVATLLVLAIASGVGVMIYHPPVYSASATIQAKPNPGFPMTPEQMATWTSVHEGLLQSAAVMKSGADRMRQQQIEEYASPEAFSRFVKSSVSHASPEPGMLEIRLSARGTDQTKRLLDTLTATVISVANADRGRRTDRAQTIVTVPATVDPIPVRDDRPFYTVLIFSGLVLVAGLLWRFFFGQMMVAARAVQADRGLFETMVDQDRWKEIQDNRNQAYEEHDLNEV